jgi:PAS domain S-box-containing protein
MSEVRSEAKPFREWVTERLGVLPNFFCTAEAAPEVVEKLWDFAKAAYFDNPLPSLFKERLFVHLSRFCVVRYCIIRHAGFLLGAGYPAGDPDCPPQSVHDVEALLSRPIPDADGYEWAISRLGSMNGPAELPGPGSPQEGDLLDALTLMFVAPRDSARALTAVQSAFGERNLELLLAFLGFVRMAHYWTETHPGLAIEPDMIELMDEHATLAALLLDPSEAERIWSPSERALTFARLRENEDEQSFRLLVESVVDYALFMLDTEGRVTSWNPGAERIKGYTAREIIGQHFSRFYTPEDRQNGLPARALEIARREGRFEAEAWRCRKDGTRFWANVVIDPVYQKGQLVGFAKITRDLTERRQTQLELEKSREALAQSQKMESIGQLTGGLAHDFNNLLTGITGSLDLIQKRMAEGRTDQLDRYIAAAQSSATRAASLTHRLLAFARRQTLDPKPTDVNKLISEIMELVERAIGPQIERNTKLQANLWATLCDSNQLENALLNLCINARDAMPEGGLLTIETSNLRLDEAAARGLDLEPGEYVAIGITDTGVGMAPGVIARAFEPFFTTKPLGQGTGLGLSMVYGFAAQSGGKVAISSELGAGTTISLYLPRYEGEVAAGTALEPAGEPVARPGETVVLVEDEPMVRLFMTDVLQDLGYNVLEASDGASGLNAVLSTPDVDLLITDVGLPGGMNGRQLADAARQKRPDLKVLFITGYAESAVVINNRLERGMHVLSKPFTLEVLSAKISAILVDQT